MDMIQKETAVKSCSFKNAFAGSSTEKVDIGAPMMHTRLMSDVANWWQMTSQIFSQIDL